jgi:hypothetical protein
MGFVGFPVIALLGAVDLGWLNVGSLAGSIVSLSIMPVIWFVSVVFCYLLGRDSEYYLWRPNRRDEMLTREELRLLLAHEEFVARLREHSNQGARLEAEGATKAPAT